MVREVKRVRIWDGELSEPMCGILIPAIYPCLSLHTL